jgi:type VII secretion protein EccCb
VIFPPGSIFPGTTDFHLRMPARTVYRYVSWRSSLAKQNYIDRPPRIQPELPSGDFTIPNPPELEENTSQPLLQAGLPMITIIGYVLVSLLGKGRSLLLIIPMGIAVVGSTLVSLYTMRRNRQLREEKEKAYKQRLYELRKDMERQHDMQRQFYNFNYPDIATTLRIAEDLGLSPQDRQEDTRAGSRLWERRPTDADFGSIRLGSGTLPSTVHYKLSQGEDFNQLLTLEAIRLQEDSLYVSDVSIITSLRAPAVQQGLTPPPTRYAIGITGNNHAAVYGYIRTMLIDFTAFHSPNDTHLYIVGAHESRQHWRWAFPLPHVKEGPQSESLCFEQDPAKKSEKEQDELVLFWKNLRNILERRKIRLEDKESGGDVTLPFMLVVVDALNLPEGSSLRDLESNATVSMLLAEGALLGAAVIFLVPERAKVPSPCQAVIEVELDISGNGMATFRYAEVDVNTPRYVGRLELVRTQEIAMRFAKQLEPLSIRRSYGADLATSVTLLEMVGLTSIEDLQKLAQQNWARSRDPRSADWLNVNLGLLSGNEVRRLVFSAKGDGVHGLVAGSTGSGKSELLMTLIMGLAINYDPSVVNFVLVDYKGGAAFEPFRELPHVVDIVTNLEGSATGRMFASIKAELDRRQRLNTFTDSKDIVAYYKKGLHRKEGSPPYPFLFIIIDEFAEMISGNAEFKSQLESITRLGRALGVHLILAAQRPVGVTDQMRANIKFRICLRVETPDDSRELLRRSDAAFLPPGIPGRGYLQVGNENIELIQVAYIGGDYRGPQENVSPNVIWLNRPKKSAQQAEEFPKLYDVAVSRLESLAKGENVPKQWRPWPAFLPRSFSLQTPLDLAYMTDNDIALIRGDEPGPVSGPATQPVPPDAGSKASQEVTPAAPVTLNRAVTQWLTHDYRWPGIDWAGRAMRPVVGIMDNPYEARQLPLVINLPVGHAVLFGASGWGKTTFLRTLILSLAATHSPDELHMYIMDFGGRNLFAFRDLPHVGAIITSEEEERINRLLRKLGSIIEERQALLSEAGLTDIYSYNQKNPGKPLPAVLVVVDNFAEFKENFEGLLPTLISLVREARAYGVHFVITADQPNAVPGKLYSLFTERMTLKLSDATEYTTVVGRGVPDMGNIYGRGVTRVGRIPLEFQVALPIGEDEDPTKRVDEAEQLKRIAQRMTAVWAGAWKGTPPASIETLPIRVSLEKALASAPAPTSRRLMPVIGLDDQNLEWFRLDLTRQGPHMVIIGQSNSGKTTTLRTLVLSLGMTYSPDEVMMVLIDFQRRFFEYGNPNTQNLGLMPHVVQTVSNVDQLEELFTNLKKEGMDLKENPNRRKVYVLIDNYDSFSDEGNRKNRKAFEEMAIMAREYGTAGLHFIASGSLAMMSAMDDLRKQIQASNYGLALATAEAVTKLNGKVQRSLADAELPLGRGFIVKSGRTSMLQLATPYASDDNIEASLDSWLAQIRSRYTKRAAWLGQAPADTPLAEPVYNLNGLIGALKNRGVTEAELKDKTQADLLHMATSQGIDLHKFKK